MTNFNEDYIKYAEMCAKVVKNEMDEIIIGISESKITELVGRFGFLAMKNVGFLKEINVEIGLISRRTFYKILEKPVVKEKKPNTDFGTFLNVFYPDAEIVRMNENVIKEYLNWKFGDENSMVMNNKKKTCENCKFSNLLPIYEPCSSCCAEFMDGGDKCANWEPTEVK